MDYGGTQLKNTNIIEEIDANTPTVLRRAIAFAGRLAADGGANVYSDASVHEDEASSLAYFFNDQKKPRSQAPSDAIKLSLDHSLTNGVVARIWPKGYSAQDRPASDLTLQAASGICHLIGDPEKQPLKLGGHQAAYATGYAIYAGLVSTLLQTHRFGGDHVAEVDAFSALTWVNWKAIAMGALGKELIREGRRAEWLVFPCKDGHAAMVFFEPHWPIICDLIGDPILRDERISTFKGREDNRALYQTVFAKWFAERSKGEIGKLMDENGIPNGAVATPTDMLTDALVTHRGGLMSLATNNCDDDRSAPPLPSSPTRFR